MPFTSLDPALDLQTLCRLLTIVDSQQAVLMTSAHQGVDKAVEFAHLHNVLGVLLPRIKATLCPSILLEERLAAAETVLTAQALFREHQLKTVLMLLADADVEVVALKGAFLASCVYGDFTARPMNDFDLLVQKAMVPRAAAALQKAGYTCDDGSPDHIPPGGSLELHSREGQAIELRYELTQGTRLHGVFRFSEDEMWARRRTYETFYGTQLLGLCPTDHLLYLAYHAGVLHLFTALIWLVDLDRFVRTFCREILWTDLVTRAKRIGCATCLWHGLELAKQLLGTPVEDTVLQALRPHAIRAALVRHCLASHKVLKGMIPPAQPRMQALQMLLIDSTAEDLRCLWQGLFPPQQWLSWRYQTSNPLYLVLLRALYPLGGWALSRK